MKQLKRRVVQILDACKNWEVRLVVFPEYSIPPEILSDIAAATTEIVVVAESHFVSDDVIDAGYYEKLGLIRGEELFESAVSPVIHGGKIIALVKQVHPAAFGELQQHARDCVEEMSWWERNVTARGVVKYATRLASVQLPDEGARDQALSAKTPQGYVFWKDETGQVHVKLLDN